MEEFTRNFMLTLFATLEEICLKKYQERCRALNRSSEVFPQQLKVPRALQGVDILVVSVGIGGIYPRTS